MSVMSAAPDDLVIECVQALQAAQAHPDARREVSSYLQGQGWIAAPTVIDLTAVRPPPLSSHAE